MGFKSGFLSRGTGWVVVSMTLKRRNSLVVSREIPCGLHEPHFFIDLVGFLLCLLVSFASLLVSHCFLLILVSSAKGFVGFEIKLLRLYRNVNK